MTFFSLFVRFLWKLMYFHVRFNLLKLLFCLKYTHFNAESLIIWMKKAQLRRIQWIWRAYMKAITHKHIHTRKNPIYRFFIKYYMELSKKNDVERDCLNYLWKISMFTDSERMRTYEEKKSSFNRVINLSVLAYFFIFLNWCCILKSFFKMSMAEVWELFLYVWKYCCKMRESSWLMNL